MYTSRKRCLPAVRYLFTFSLILLMATLTTSCVVSTSFSGPGYDSKKGTVISSSDTVVVGLTHAVLGNDSKKNALFWKNIKRVVASLPSQPGFIGYRLRREIGGKNAWTMTVWQDEASLQHFVASEVHQRAIREGFGALAGNRLAHITVDKKEIPLSWDRAEEILAERARSY